MTIKTRAASLSMILMTLLPLVLGACGSSPTDNATKLLEAIAENDKGKAEDATCDNVHDEIDVLFDLMADSEDDIDYNNIDCKEDGDDVRCSVTIDEEEESALFSIDDGKVCGGELFDDIRALDDASAEDSTEDLLPTAIPSSD